MANPLVKVYSFPRSGTHWLMSLLKSRFYGSQDVSATNHDEVLQLIGWGGAPVKEVPWFQLFGGHWYNPTRAIIRPPMKEFVSFEALKQSGIYIIRDVYDTLASGFRLQVTAGTFKGTLSQYLRVAIGDPNLPNCFPPLDNICDSTQTLVWQWSTRLWMAAAAHGVLSVSYEALMLDKERVLLMIAQHFGLEEDRTPGANEDIAVGFAPSRKPRSKHGIELFSPEDLAYVDECGERAEELLQKDPWYCEHSAEKFV